MRKRLSTSPRHSPTCELLKSFHAFLPIASQCHLKNFLSTFIFRDCTVAPATRRSFRMPNKDSNLLVTNNTGRIHKPSTNLSQLKRRSKSNVFFTKQNPCSNQVQIAEFEWMCYCYYPNPSEGRRNGGRLWGPEARQFPRAWTRDRRETGIRQEVSGAKSP